VPPVLRRHPGSGCCCYCRCRCCPQPLLPPLDQGCRYLLHLGQQLLLLGGVGGPAQTALTRAAGGGLGCSPGAAIRLAQHVEGAAPLLLLILLLLVVVLLLLLLLLLLGLVLVLLVRRAPPLEAPGVSHTACQSAH
jgi:hypothetical protein